MKKALKIFTVRGTGIYLHWTFIFLIAWILDVVANGHYNDQISGLLPPDADRLYEESPADEAIDKLMQKGPAVYPVLNGSRVTGIVNLETIVENLLVRNISVKGFPGAGAVSRFLH